MKKFLPFLLALTPFLGFSQNLDSLIFQKVDSLITLSDRLKKSRQSKEAMQVMEEGKNLLIQRVEKKDTTYARYLNSIGERLYAFRAFEEAILVFFEVREIYLKVLGKNSRPYAQSVNDMGVLHKVSRQYDRAEELYLEAKAIREKIVGKEHPDYLESLQNLVSLYLAQSRFKEAEPYYLEMKKIRKKVSGEKSPEYAEILNNLGIFYYYQGQYENAERFYLKGKEIREKVYGKKHLAYAQSIANLAVLYENKGRYAEAEALYLEAKAIREDIVGKDHPSNATTLNNLAGLYKALGRYEEAEEIYLKAKAIREKDVGKEHPVYAGSLNNLAVLYHHQGRYEKAMEHYQAAKEIWEKSSRVVHPDYATCLNNLGVLYKEKGRYDVAESLYLKSKAVRQKLYGNKHPEYAVSLQNLADLYFVQGRYEEAEPVYLEAKAIRREVLGEKHPDYSTSLTSLAILYYYQGQYEKAEPLFYEAKAIRKETLGEQHPQYANSLHNLAGLFEVQGRYEDAEPLYVKAMQIREEVLGKEHPKYAESLNNLAGIYQAKGQYDKAEGLYLQAMTIFEKKWGKNHPKYALTLNNLTSIYFTRGQYEEVEALLQEVKEIWGETQGKEHPNYATSLSNLAKLYRAQGRYEEAEPLFEEAKRILEKAIGKEHPDYAKILYEIAGLYKTQGRYGEAEPLYRQANSIQRQIIFSASRYMSERELGAYVLTFRKRIAELSSFSLKAYSPHSETSTLLYDNTLFHKGLLLQSVLDLRRAVQSSPDSVKTLFYKWKGLHRRLAQQYSKPLAEREGVEDLENRANELEKELTRLVVGFEEARRQVSWKEVQDQLQQDEAAVEFTHFRYRDTSLTDSIIYCALVLRPGYEYPRLVPLFEESQMEGLFHIDTDNRQDQVTQLYAARDATRGAGLANKGQYPDFYRLVWQPLDSLLEGVGKICYAPSGLLHRISFPAIRVDSSTFLSDRYQLQQTSSTRSLVVRGRESTAPSQTAVLFGDITYRTDSIALAEGRDTTQTTGTYLESIVASEIAPKVNCGQNESCHWTLLPGTRNELERLLPLFSEKAVSTQVYLKYQASEEAFKRIGEGAPSPDILHVATHGYFAPDPEQREEEEKAVLSGQPAFRFSEQPLLRSGLILAGADTAWCTGVGLNNLEDGTLTAYEISQMDLSNTKLAVLSACETGLGDIKGSEGVYGLQRAFRMAGVDYLLLSLWPVADSEETIEFMETFYRHWLSGMPIRDAFDETQRAMRAKYPDPYYWAGFVLID